MNYEMGLFFVLGSWFLGSRGGQTAGVFIAEAQRSRGAERRKLQNWGEAAAFELFLNYP
jgi:hypothetical protein